MRPASDATARSGPRGGAANEQGSALRGNLAAYLASYGLANMSVRLGGEGGPCGVPTVVRCEVDEPVDALMVYLAPDAGDTGGYQVLVQVKQRLELDFKPDRPMAKVVDQWIGQCLADDAARAPLVVVGLSASRTVDSLRAALNRHRDTHAGLPTRDEKDALDRLRKAIDERNPR